MRTCRKEEVQEARVIIDLSQSCSLKHKTESRLNVMQGLAFRDDLVYP